PLLPPHRTEQGLVSLLDPQEWLLAAQMALRRSKETDHPDLARILCYTNRRLEQLVPFARRALHGEMADTTPVLPGEVLITRAAVMAPACMEDAAAPEDPEMCLSSNREVVVREVTPGQFFLAEWGLSSFDLPGDSVIETLMVRVDAGDGQLTLRLLPPIGTSSRAVLDLALQRLRTMARRAENQAARRHDGPPPPRPPPGWAARRRGDDAPEPFLNHLTARAT
ncbi:MAG: hypothetical protein ACO307_12480, partial [Ilumatobacteraceae bacterium]